MAVNEETSAAINELQLVAAQQNVNISLLTDSIKDLARAIDARPTKRQSLNLTMVIAVITLIAVGLMYRPLLDNQNQIKDCTNVGGECYERSRAATAGVVGQIQLTSIFVAQCALDGATDLEACVAEKLTERAGGGSEAP